MSEHLRSPGFVAVVVAAGRGLRAGQARPKQFAFWRGKPLLRHSLEALRDSGARSICVAIPEGMENLARDAADGIENVRFVVGGETRQLSVRNALENLVCGADEVVLVHDAARPDLPREVVHRLVSAVGTGRAAIPVRPIVDSLVLEADGMMLETAPRERLFRVQTPQAFLFGDILSAHRAWQGPPDAGDDAQVFRANGGEVKLIEGDEALTKVTFAEDFMNSLPICRTGMGFDVHRLAAGEELWLGGIRIDHPKGLAGHSDADVALHAIVDALLGAIGAGDIGTHFPPSDARWKDASSDRFVRHAAEEVKKSGYAIGNVDLTLICEEPKIGPHRSAMQTRIAELLRVDSALVSVKATTTERLGFTGRGEGIAAQAIATLIRD